MFYHGTNVRGLKELKPAMSNQGEWIYLSDERLRVLPYCVNPIQVYADKKYGKGKVRVGTRMADIGFADGVLYMNGLYPNFFQEIFGGQTGYVYTFKNLEGLQDLGLPHVYGYKDVLKVEKVEVIPDMYKELCRLEKEGRVVLRRYEDMDEDYKNKIGERYLEYYKNSKNKFSQEFWFENIHYIRENLEIETKND